MILKPGGRSKAIRLALSGRRRLCLLWFESGPNRRTAIGQSRHGCAAKNVRWGNSRHLMKVELLRGEKVFDLATQGLVCAPFLQPSQEMPFRNFSAVVTVQLPGRQAFDVSASFELTHFNIRDLNAPVQKRWQVVTCLGRISKESVPVGRVIFCDSETRARLSTLL